MILGPAIQNYHDPGGHRPAGLDTFAHKAIGNATIFSFNYNTGGSSK
jgi:hypothetical protein